MGVVLNGPPLAANLILSVQLAFPRAASSERGIMEGHRTDELRTELFQLLDKQKEVLQSRTFGSANDTELLEYEIRQEIIHDICERLAQSVAG